MPESIHLCMTNNSNEPLLFIDNFYFSIELFDGILKVLSQWKLLDLAVLRVKIFQISYILILIVFLSNVLIDKWWWKWLQMVHNCISNHSFANSIRKWTFWAINRNSFFNKENVGSIFLWLYNLVNYLNWQGIHCNFHVTELLRLWKEHFLWLFVIVNCIESVFFEKMISSSFEGLFYLFWSLLLFS